MGKGDLGLLDPTGMSSNCDEEEKIWDGHSCLISTSSPIFRADCLLVMP